MAREDPQKAFRAPEEEMNLIHRAIVKSGLPDGVWIRVMLLAAAGNTTLSEQLWRAHKAGNGR